MPTKFENKCYTLLKKVPSGKVTTYKEIAKALNKKGLIYRAIGRAIANNPFAPKEGIIIKNNKINNFEKVLYKF